MPNPQQVSLSKETLHMYMAQESQERGKGSAHLDLSPEFSLLVIVILIILATCSAPLHQRQGPEACAAQAMQLTPGSAEGSL